MPKQHPEEKSGREMLKTNAAAISGREMRIRKSEEDFLILSQKTGEEDCGSDIQKTAEAISRKYNWRIPSEENAEAISRTYIWIRPSEQECGGENQTKNAEAIA